MLKIKCDLLAGVCQQSEQIFIPPYFGPQPAFIEGTLETVTRLCRRPCLSFSYGQPGVEGASPGACGGLDQPSQGTAKRPEEMERAEKGSHQRDWLLL